MRHRRSQIAALADVADVPIRHLTTPNFVLRRGWCPELKYNIMDNVGTYTYTVEAVAFGINRVHFINSHD